jgi:hypothetical protein
MDSVSVTRSNFDRRETHHDLAVHRPYKPAGTLWLCQPFFLPMVLRHEGFFNENPSINDQKSITIFDSGE